MNYYPPGARIAGQYEVAGAPLLGGMGIVYVCHDREEDRPVALKTFKPEYLPDRAARDRFLREGTHWVELGRHPHVVRAHGVERIGDGREVYLVLELVAKEQGREDASLRSWLAPGVPLPVETALLFGLQIARGMKHAAAKIPGFVHRDLKPGNVLVGADRLSSAGVNRLRVTDFGLASVLEEAGDGEIGGEEQESGGQRPVLSVAEGSAVSGPLARTQLTRGVVGTPLYMAPEQWRGEPVGIWTDVYALGCMLVEMLTGERAVAGGSLRALERAHCGGAIRPLPGAVPGAVRDVVARCVALEAEARYGSWEAHERALGAAYAEVTGRAAPGAEGAGVLSREERMAAGWSYSALGVSYLDIGKAEVALGYFERAAEVGRDEGERKLEGAGLMHLGMSCADLGEARGAVGYYEQALVIWRKIGDRRGEGAALGNLGNAYLHLGEPRQAIGCYEQALVIHREMGDRMGEGNDLINLGEVYRLLGETRRAIGYHEQALVIDREIGNRRGEGAALGSLGNAYLQLEDARRAIGYYKRCLTVHREIGDRRGEGNILGNLGEAYRRLGEARPAIGYHEQSLTIAREIGDRTGEGNALGSLGNAYRQLGEARRAIGYYERHLEIAREIGDLMGVAGLSFNMALLHAQQGEPKRALPLARQAAQLFAQMGHAGHAQQAQKLVAELQAGAAASSGRSSDD